MIGDAGEDVSEPCLRVDAIELCGLMSVYMRAARSARARNRRTAMISCRAPGRERTFGGVLKGMVPATPLFRLAFIA